MKYTTKWKNLKISLTLNLTLRFSTRQISRGSSYSPNRRCSDLVSEISFFPFYLFISRLFLFYQRLGFPSVSVTGLSPASTGSGVLSSVRRTTARENKAYPYSQSVNHLPPGYTVHMANQALLCKYGKGCWFMHEEGMNLVVLSDEPWNWCICIASLSRSSLAYCAVVRVRYVRVSVPHTVIRVERAAFVNFYSSNETNVRCH